jgi:hypothetical protein
VLPWRRSPSPRSHNNNKRKKKKKKLRSCTPLLPLRFALYPHRRAKPGPLISSRPSPRYNEVVLVEKKKYEYEYYTRKYVINRIISIKIIILEGKFKHGISNPLIR